MYYHYQLLVQSFLLFSLSLTQLFSSSVVVVDGFSAGTEIKGVVIFCHGSGDSGSGAKAYIEQVTPAQSQRLLRDSAIIIEYPDARLRPYRLNYGYTMRIWFDRYGGMDPQNSEDTPSVEESASRLNELIDDLITNRGIPPEKIALGGFSMGGGIALQTAARSSHTLGAVFALSSYLCNDSWVWKELEKYNASTTRRNEKQRKVNGLLTSPVFMAHGSSDDFVLPKWGKDTASRLKSLGVDIQQFLLVPGAGHQMTREELEELFQFLFISLDQKPTRKIEL